jgi:outer membrane protein TolC
LALGVGDAARSHALFEERQKSGVGGALEAILSEETLTEARLDYIDAVSGHNKAQVRLLHALGGLR